MFITLKTVKDIYLNLSNKTCETINNFNPRFIYFIGMNYKLCFSIFKRPILYNRWVYYILFVDSLMVVTISLYCIYYSRNVFYDNPRHYTELIINDNIAGTCSKRVMPFSNRFRIIINNFSKRHFKIVHLPQVL